MNRFNKYCREIYYGMSARALRAQYLFLVLDLLIISYFVVTTFLDPHEWIVAVDMAIGIVLVIDFLCRLSAQFDRGAFLVRPMTIIDFVVIASLFVPALIGNFAFLRLVRSLRLMRSYIVVRQLRQHMRFFATNEDVSKWTVFFGASLALIVASGMGVVAGAMLGEFINPKYLSYAAGSGFIVIGIWTVATA